MRESENIDGSATGPQARLDEARLEALDAAVRRMLLTGERRGFDLIGAGELACVVGIEGFALKRLPPVEERARLEAYGTVLNEYLRALRTAGVAVIETEWRVVASGDVFAGYLVQRRVGADALLPGVVRRGCETEAVEILETILDRVDACVDAGIGIDPQISNWCMLDGKPVLLDVTTPMLRDEEGRDRLDTDLFVAMLPWVIRSFVRRFMVADLLDKNFEKHGILLDLIGNIVNYDLGHLTGVFLPRINARLEAPITEKEIATYRRSEVLAWGAIRRALRIEQWWKRNVLRRPSLHLLPSEYRSN